MAPFSTTDTIVALATPRARGALGIVRLSGPCALGIATMLTEGSGRLAPRRATFARVARGASAAPDQVIATWFPAPHSYTGEDCVEISAHGSVVVLDGIVDAAVAGGARRAGPGEFTLRAFLNGRIDLTQAEAVADLSAAVTPRQAHAAFAQLEGRLGAAIEGLSSRLLDLTATLEASLDFPEEGYHFADHAAVSAMAGGMGDEIESLLSDAGTGCLLRDGATVVVTGRPNTGKSSLFNRLLRMERAIVSSFAGTTRDILAESVDLNGVPVTLIDTAGRHDAPEAVEAEGVRRAERAAARADVEVLVLDGSEPLRDEDRRLLAAATPRTLLVVNKTDLPGAWPMNSVSGGPIGVSALTGAGLDVLVEAVERRLGGFATIEVPRVTNVRHVELLRAAGAALARAKALADARSPEEIVLVEVNAARTSLEEVTGRRTSEDVLAAIFERFCLGK